MAFGKKSNYSIDMTTGPLLPQMLRFAVPLMLSSILQLLFNAADLVVVSRFAGDNAMAAVGANSALINLLITLFMGLAVGANVQASMERGAGKMEELDKTVHTAMLLSLIGGVVLIFVGLVSAPLMLGWMGAPAAILDQAVLYLRIYFLGMPANMVYNFGAALLRSVGDTRRPLYYLTFAGVVNVVLNLILVIVFHLDVAGVGIATVASQVISAVLVVRCMLRAESDIHLDLRRLRIHKEKVRGIVRVGLPAGLQGTMFALSNVVIQSSVNSFGEIVVAGNAASLNLEGFIYCVEGALMQAAQSFTGQNVGAGKYERLPRILTVAVGCAAVSSVVIAILGVFVGESLLGIYTQTPEVLQAGMNRLSLMTKVYFLASTMDIMVGTLRGMGKAVMPTLVSLVGVCGFRLVWIATVFRIPAYHSILTVYVSYPITWALTSLAHFCCWFVIYRKLRRVYEETESKLHV